MTIHMPHNMDDVFNRHRGDVPLSLARATSYLESSFKPDAKNPASSATGLFQCINAVRQDYNASKGTAYVQEDLKQAEIGAEIGLWYIRRIADGLVKNHPRTAVRNWDERFTGYVILGFVCGPSEEEGVGSLLSDLEGRGMKPEAITLDALLARAKEDEYPSYWNDANVNHVKNIVALYLRDQQEMAVTVASSGSSAETTDSTNIVGTGGSGLSGGTKAAMAGGFGLALVALLKKFRIFG
jgi:hypothetical protein